MSVLKYFKTTPGRSHRATCPNCNFFSSNLQRDPWQKKYKEALSPPQRATGGPVAPPGRPMGPAHRRDMGAYRPPRATGACSPI